MNENDIMNEEEQIKLPKPNNNGPYKFHYNYYSPNNEKDIRPTTYEINYNNDIRQFNTSPKMNQHHSNFKKINISNQKMMIIKSMKNYMHIILKVY